MPIKVVILAGGGGGARLAYGFAQILPPENLTIIVNTGDDFVHCGLTVCPDLDTVMHTLAGVDNRETGWGRAGESWRVMEHVRQLGGPDWFALGDVDLATHLTRSHWLAQGAGLSEVTARLCQQLGVAHTILPMSDTPAQTLVETEQGTMAFQTWFVKERWQPAVEQVILPDAVRTTKEVISALHEADVVVIGPSNPFVSVDPILNAYPIRPILADECNNVIAVSPIIAGQAVKGPTVKMMQKWQMPVNATTIANYYADLITAFVYDEQDSEPVALDQLPTFVTNTWMRSDADRARLAHEILEFAQS